MYRLGMSDSLPTLLRTEPLGGPIAAAEDGGNGVALVRWPQDHQTLAELREAGRPRLLLVEGTSPPPLTVDLDEDWIRLPASDADLHARLAAIAARAALLGRAPRVTDGRLLYDGRWIALSPLEESLVTELVAEFGDLVSLDRLARSVDGHELTANAVRVHVMRLRKRIRAVGLGLRTIHGRGYLLEAD